MRFSVSYLIVSLLAAFVAATPIAEPAPPCKDCPHPPPSQDEITVQQCGNGDLQCCNDIQKASSEASQNLLGLLAAVAGVAVDPSTNLGLNCESSSQRYRLV